MLFLVTGSNGTGKTLFTLKWVRELQLYWQKKKGVNRPVYYDGFEINADIAKEFGWQPCDPTKWEELPDNSIIMVDECQRIYPTRSQGAPVPEHEQKIATDHRKRGMDFFLVCQHPTQINTFIRNLIGSGWHRHLKRVMGLSASACLEFNYAETSCQKPTAGKSAYRKMTLRFPKDVYKWYNSAVAHTSKVNIPPLVWYTLLAFVVVVLAVWKFYTSMIKDEPATTGKHETVQMASVGSASVSDVRPGRNRENQPMSAADYIKTFEPRIPDYPHTASRYDEITKPVTAPYPAACIYSSERDVCKCYTQQATPLQMDKAACIKMAQNGYFLDWEPDSQRREGENRDDRG